ncbi:MULTISPECIES: response regulator transcription factor [Mucilaginibacter]|jgi:DNA-binding NarL/FixJ family response regulator|uniref:Response regulator transcription factor n=2 Tax=Mucilaginibacter TaxID=423349 RepID=A0AAE6MJ10_9SPHI|nr:MULTISPECIES: response regulator transcription factor [Mucilaginibacter]QEM04717.1 response regulator transcription factor [Mucilaginibacter rubeus]QEM17311.1 response regulator transcription factor [Mucilaginibacter gossypii]QTE37681.1 response regulator transcription factor [Mucilaginibacter gossypii]QTE46177.1 response regulator transcription factor [Mucilaginibacter rubeus]QTE52774.1 response regulator transcription factor [Mucilaginibacter rubeus]
MARNIKVSIIEDDETLRDGYAFLIGATEGYDVISTYCSYDEAAKKIAADKPDVILLDIELPGVNGIDAIPKLKKLLPNCYILILTVYESEKQIFNALANGASGYLTKNTPSTKIIESIKEVREGGGPMSINIARLVIRSFQKNQESPLSKRETQILELIGEGKSRGQIANELFIDLETVRSHIKNIYLKLDVNSRADAIKLARQNKLI